MDTGSDSIRDGFVRQRRSLVAISLVLFFYQTSGVVIESINVLGNTLRLTNPPRVSAVLWIGWFYFLLRYYQHFRDTPDKGISAAYYGRLHILARRVAQKKFKRDFVPDEKFADRKGPLHFNFSRMEVFSAYPSFWEIEVNADVSYQTETGVASHHLGNRKLNLSRTELLIPRVRSLLHVIVDTRLVTEYFLPYLVALIPVVYQMMMWTNL